MVYESMLSLSFFFYRWMCKGYIYEGDIYTRFILRKFVKKVVQAFLFDVIRIVDKKLKVL